MFHTQNKIMTVIVLVSNCSFFTICLSYDHLCIMTIELITINL